MELDYEYLAQLVRKTQKGDSDAFAELYTATYQRQYRFAYQYVKDPYLAQDILQDVYILVLKNIRTLKNPRLFVSWLHQITFRICFDTFKRKQIQEAELCCPRTTAVTFLRWNPHLTTVPTIQKSMS